MGIALGMLLTGSLAQMSFVATGTLQPTANASLTANPGNGPSPLFVTFEVSVGPPSSAGCEPETYALAFGDGSLSATGNATGPGQVFHFFLFPGSYTAILSFTREEDVGSPMPDCRQVQATVSVPISVQDPPPLHFIGADGNWFNSANWDRGKIPSSSDNALIDGDHLVIIDPKRDTGGGGRGRGKVELNTLRIRDNASLTTEPGTVLTLQSAFIETTGKIALHSSCLSGGYFSNKAALQLNPSQVDVAVIELVGGPVTFFLGGTALADCDGKFGAGHYANINAHSISINNSKLEVNFIFDYLPQHGDTFVIIKARDELVGTFEGLADGAEVLRMGDVALYISYLSKSIMLTARKL